MSDYNPCDYTATVRYKGQDLFWSGGTPIDAYWEARSGKMPSSLAFDTPGMHVSHLLVIKGSIESVREYLQQRLDFGDTWQADDEEEFIKQQLVELEHFSDFKRTLIDKTDWDDYD